jgi:hypothetical protein
VRSIQSNERENLMKQLTKRFRIVALTILIIGIDNNPTLADLMQIDLPTKVVTSDLIARVKVVSLQGRIESMALPGVAKCKVLESAKGLKKGTHFDLVFREGTAVFSSPNVRYNTGDDCLIFATILPNGQYRTFNFSDGKYPIEDNRILRWGERGKKSRQHKIVEVMAAIRNLVDTPSDWSKPINGISVLLRPKQTEYAAGQNIDIVVLFKNISRESISIPYRAYPKETKTYWSLYIRH